MIRINNVLVATDFGTASEAAVNYGRELARTFNATLHVLHVADSITARYPLEGAIYMPPGLQNEVENAARERLSAIIREDDLRELRAKTIVRTALAPAEAIVDYAKESASDIIVVGTHGRKTVAHLLLGSVAERVVRIAPCPVLTVRTPEHEFLVPDALVAVARQL